MDNLDVYDFSESNVESLSELCKVCGISSESKCACVTQEKSEEQNMKLLYWPFKSEWKMRRISNTHEKEIKKLFSDKYDTIRQWITARTNDKNKCEIKDIQINDDRYMYVDLYKKNKKIIKEAEQLHFQ